MRTSLILVPHCRYLKSLEPLVTPEAFEASKQHVSSFLATEGPQLQAALLSWTNAHPDTSYISQMWFDMYLKDRSPLPLNLNPQLTWRDDPRPGAMQQAVRAASLVHAAVRFHLTLQAGLLVPDVFHTKKHISKHPLFERAVSLIPEAIASYGMYAVGAYPLDMSQYSRLFGSTRLPRAAPAQDELYTAPSIAAVRHIVVQRGPRFYALEVIDKDGRPVSADALVDRFQAILSESQAARGWSMCGDDTVHPRAHAEGAAYEKEPPVGALTSLDRDSWAAARSSLHSSSSRNADGLRAIDDALFVLTLDDAQPTTHATVSRTMLHGDGRNRWWDKCLNLIVAANGKAGVAWEHAWGDGSAVLYFFNALYEDVTGRSVPRAKGTGESDVVPYTPVASSFNDRPVQRVMWDLAGGAGVPLVQAIRKAEARFDTAIGATRLQVYQSDALTKEDVKASNLSPDGLMQAVLQQAHWRAHGYTPVTYESASTAAFKHGRTETIRSATAESARMCVTFAGRPGLSSTAACIPCVPSSFGRSSDPKARYEALKASTEVHKKISLAAVMGKGVDRHLFALSVWAERLGLQDPVGAGQGKRLPVFADPSWAYFKDIRLSTSTLASDALDGGGFGPVNGHSYAIGYGIEERGSQYHVMSYVPEQAERVFPGEEPYGNRVNPASVGYRPVDNAALLEAIQQSLVDVHDAIRQGGPAAAGKVAKGKA